MSDPPWADPIRVWWQEYGQSDLYAWWSAYGSVTHDLYVKLAHVPGGLNEIERRRLLWLEENPKPPSFRPCPSDQETVSKSPRTTLERTLGMTVTWDVTPYESCQPFQRGHMTPGQWLARVSFSDPKVLGSTGLMAVGATEAGARESLIVFLRGKVEERVRDLRDHERDTESRRRTLEEALLWLPATSR